VRVEREVSETKIETGRRLAELRRSNASGKHQDRRTRRLRDRGSIRRQAIKE
jgi:hypothetical protein